MIISKQEVEMSFAPNRPFKFRKADLMFDVWCAERYGSLQGFIDVVMLKDSKDAKYISYAVVGAFYHLISSEDKFFIRDHISLDEQLDDNGEPIKYNMIEKLMAACDYEDLKNLTVAVMASVRSALPIQDEKKKKNQPMKKA